MASINGIAHIQLTVSDMARSTAFYEPLLRSLDMVPLISGPDYFYCIGGRTGIALAPIAEQFRGQAFDQHRTGLHHLCLRARSRADVDEIHRTALALGATIVRAPAEGAWAPGYYSVLFEDPDGIRIEANFVPGKGHLEEK